MRLALISDIHSDLFHLEKALHVIEKMKCEQLACLGDIVGYSHHYTDYLDGRNGDECVRLVKENCTAVICGNHDLQAVRRLPPGHEDLGMPADWYRRSLEDRTAMYGQKFWLYEDEFEEILSEDSRAFLMGLPDRIVMDTGDFSILLTHFIHPDITGSRQASPAHLKAFLPHLKMMKRSRTLVGFTGHAHLEGFARITRRHYEMKYFRRSSLLNRRQLVIGPALTRSRKSRSGLLFLDTAEREFEAVPLE